MKFIHYTNGTKCKLKDKRVCVFEDKGNDGFIIEMAILDKKDAKIPRTIHKNIKDKIAITGFKISREI